MRNIHVRMCVVGWVQFVDGAASTTGVLGVRMRVTHLLRAPRTPGDGLRVCVNALAGDR